MRVVFVIGFLLLLLDCTIGADCLPGWLSTSRLVRLTDRRTVGRTDSMDGWSIVVLHCCSRKCKQKPNKTNMKNKTATTTMPTTEHSKQVNNQPIYLPSHPSIHADMRTDRHSRQQSHDVDIMNVDVQRGPIGVCVDCRVAFIIKLLGIMMTGWLAGCVVRSLLLLLFYGEGKINFVFK